MQPRERNGTVRGHGPAVWKRVIGIVGGLGPYAHLELERLILEATTRRMGRMLNDQDFPEWIVSSVPVTPDRTGALLGTVPSPLPWLERSLRRLAGCAEMPMADFAVIACATAHAYLEELRSRVALPILDMIAESMDEASRRLSPGAKVGVLATTGTLRCGLYASAAWNGGGTLVPVSLLDLNRSGVDAEQLQEELVMRPIYGQLIDGRRAGGGLKSGLFCRRSIEDAAARLTEAARLLISMGAETVITACTEIPLALRDESIDGVPLLNPMRVAAEACVEIALGNRPLPTATPARVSS
jgi:aspartate racemase